MDEPLALIKKPRKDPEGTEEKAKSSAGPQIQVMNQYKHRSALSGVFLLCTWVFKFYEVISLYDPL